MHKGNRAMHLKIYRELSDGRSDERTVFDFEDAPIRLAIMDIISSNLLNMSQGTVKIIHIEVCE